MIFSSHHQRLITGFTLLALLALILSAGGWILRLTALAVSSLALYEFFRMYWPTGVYTGRKVLGILLGALLMLSQSGGPIWILTVLCCCFFGVALSFLFRFGTGEEGVRLGHYSPLLHGLLYIPLMLQLALYLNPAEQCLALIASIGADTGGYYAGLLFGGPKLWPAVSPKKTWAGFWGGMAVCLTACTALGLVAAFAGWQMPRLPFWGWLLLSLCLHQAAVLGDFFESALKRTLEIKDSGGILPGHGGILDRIDSLLFVLPVYMLLRLFIRAAQGS